MSAKLIPITVREQGTERSDLATASCLGLRFQLFGKELPHLTTRDGRPLYTGSRAGGFNFADEQSFGAEHILSVEAGTKSMFFHDRLMLNVTERTTEVDIKGNRLPRSAQLTMSAGLLPR